MGVIFGVTGGVMEAALRTAYFVLTGKEREGIVFNEVRGFESIREAEFDLNGQKLKVAVTSGMKGAKVLLDQIREGTAPYTFIEVMGCPGGCINGGGQPYVRPALLPNEDADILDTYCEKRAAALYSEDERQQAIRDLGPDPEITRFKGLGEISPEEFAHFIGPEMRLEQVTLHKTDQVQKLLEYYMGKNTMERQNFIIDNLVVEEDLPEEDME